MNYAEIIESLGKGDLTRIEGAIPSSYNEIGNAKLVMFHDNGIIKIASTGNLAAELDGGVFLNGKISPLSNKNRKILQKHFLFLVPSAAGKQRASIGLGDRLGRATTGHIRAVRGKDLVPVFAQQSIRELALTGRTYEDVLDDAVFAVLREGYRDGFGADGDHLKTEEDIAMALDLGFTMITLDCSEKIDKTIASLPDAECDICFDTLPAQVKERYLSVYADKKIICGGSSFSISVMQMKRNVLVYHNAIEYMIFIWENYIKKCGRAIDFEISIDETATPTSPDAHFMVANELMFGEVDVVSLAPRFVGEFQKGIDYIGDKNLFEKDFTAHADIARHFGYKVSIHSGSDKFSVFPIIAKHTDGLFHVKTAGTNWLEAVKVIAEKNPSLYRQMHQYAYDHFDEAKKFYHVTTDLGAIKPLSAVSDSECVSYLADDNARQLMHITYGILLNAKSGNGLYLFRETFFSVLDANEDLYFSNLVSHIGRHISLLGK